MAVTATVRKKDKTTPFCHWDGTPKASFLSLSGTIFLALFIHIYAKIL